MSRAAKLQRDQRALRNDRRGALAQFAFPTNVRVRVSLPLDSYAYVCEEVRLSMPRTKRRRRAAWGTLSRDQVIDAAERRVRAGDYESLSMRSLAADLGVSPMSLYGHVRDKDDLLDQVVDRLLASQWEPSRDRGNWLDWIRELAERLRDLLIAEPAALHVFLTHPVVSPTAIVRMETTLEVLRSAGFSAEGAEHVYAALHTYTVGFAALEASRAQHAPTEGMTDSNRTRLARFTTAAQFRRGLNYLLEGINHARTDGRR